MSSSTTHPVHAVCPSSKLNKDNISFQFLDDFVYELSMHETNAETHCKVGDLTITDNELVLNCEPLQSQITLR